MARHQASLRAAPITSMKKTGCSEASLHFKKIRCSSFEALIHERIAFPYSSTSAVSLSFPVVACTLSALNIVLIPASDAKLTSRLVCKCPIFQKHCRIVAAKRVQCTIEYYSQSSESKMTCLGVLDCLFAASPPSSIG